MEHWRTPITSSLRSWPNGCGRSRNYGPPWWDRTYLDELTAPLFGLLPKKRAGQVVPPLLVPGVREMLEALRPHYRMAVVTARSEHQGHQLLKAAEIDHYFEAVVTTRSVRRAKPHPAPVLWAAEQLDIPAERCLMVGDTTLDIRSGNAAGAQTVAVLCGLGEKPELARLDPSLLLEKTSDLVNYLAPSDRAAG